MIKLLLEIFGNIQYAAVVLYLGSIEHQGFGESVSVIRRQEILSNKSKIHGTHFIFITTKGSMNACVELVGFSIFKRLRTTGIQPSLCVSKLISRTRECFPHIAY